jgi:hypothetical protein
MATDRDEVAEVIASLRKLVGTQRRRLVPVFSEHNATPQTPVYMRTVNLEQETVHILIDEIERLRVYEEEAVRFAQATIRRWRDHA